MIEIAVLAQAVTTFLLPALPYLVKAGEAAAQETGKKLLGGAWDATKSLWDKLKPKVEAKAEALSAVKDVAQDPKDADLQAAFRVQIKKLLSEDEAFATEIEQLLNNAKAISGSQVSATDGGIAFGDNAKDNIAVTGGIHGDFVMGDKHKP